MRLNVVKYFVQGRMARHCILFLGSVRKMVAGFFAIIITKLVGTIPQEQGGYPNNQASTELHGPLRESRIGSNAVVLSPEIYAIPKISASPKAHVCSLLIATSPVDSLFFFLSLLSDLLPLFVPVCLSHRPLLLYSFAQISPHTRFTEGINTEENFTRDLDAVADER